ncbi:MAG: DUF3558 domain-containing protein [Tomitella sp.]|nr:DUF3558 domain-containing protein [Tomitella sp.]
MTGRVAAPRRRWRWKSRSLAPVTAMVALCLTLAGCTESVDGDAATGRGGTEPSANRQYAKLLEECMIVPVDTIAQVLGTTAVFETFSGAVCRWRSIDGGTDVQFNWFETGTMRTEKDTAEQLGYGVENVRISGGVAYVVRPPDDPASCGAVARASGEGVVGWWVHSSPADPCEAARKLVELSVNRAL